MYFEDFETGQQFETRPRTLTDADIDSFIRLSGDSNRLHTDVDFARSVGFESRLVHGMLVLSAVTGLIAELALLEGTALSFLELEWRFRKTVVAGDTIRAVLVVQELRPTKRDDRGVLKRTITILNQDGVVVQEGMQTLLIKRRTRGADDD